MGARQRRPRSREAVGEPADARLRVFLTTDADARRWTALVLQSVAGWSYCQIQESVPGVSPKAIREWKAKTLDSHTPEPRKRQRRKADIGAPALAAVQQALRTGGQGNRRRQSLRAAHPRLVAAGIVRNSMEKTRRALHDADWASVPVRKALPITPAGETARHMFCMREARIIAANTAYSDSKYFEGNPTAKSSLGHAWGPKGEKIYEPVPQSSAIKFHAYAAITRFGATELFKAPGTTHYAAAGARGGRGRGRGRGRGAAQPPRSVDSTFYRQTLDDGSGGGMLAQCCAIFARHGISTWRWQQDGAKPHSIADTDIGNRTRALIERQAEIVEPWPAHSPDLSPIEKAWQATQDHVNAYEQWNDAAGYEAAVRRAWRAVVTPSYCRRLFGCIRATYERCVRDGGKQVHGWGHNA